MNPSADRRLQELLRQFGRPGLADGVAERPFHRPADPPTAQRPTRPHRLDLDRLGPGLWQDTAEGPVFALDRAPGGDGPGRIPPGLAEDCRWESVAQLYHLPPEGPPGLGGAAFLDTETTGLGGGTGTYVFLVGIAYFEAGEVRLRQYLLDSPAREGAMLRALLAFLERFEALVTFNGAGFDLPLLETRLITARLRPSLSRLPHLDLLHPARRLYRGRLPSCRLQELERSLLGFEREGDLPGYEVPGRYFHYVRSGSLEPLRDVLSHNGQDVISLMSLAAYLARLVEQGPEDGRDALALARLHERAGRHERAAAVYGRALEHPLASGERREALRRLAVASRRAGDWEGAAAAWRRLIEEGEEFSVRPYVELAKHHEHRRGEPEQALAYARQALAALTRWSQLAPGWAMHHRQALEGRAARLGRKLKLRYQ